MTSLRVFAATLVLGFGALTASAQAQGTAQQRAACMGDAFKFCSSHIPNASAIESCLRGNISQLKPACQAVLQPESAAPAPSVAARAPRDSAQPREEARAPRRGRDPSVGALASNGRGVAATGGVGNCLRHARRLQARVERYFTSDPGGAAQDMIGAAMAFMPMITSMANGGSMNLEGLNLGGVNLGGMNFDNGDEVLQTAMSLLSQAREAGFSGSAEGCRTAVDQVEQMIPRGRRR